MSIRFIDTLGSGLTPLLPDSVIAVLYELYNPFAGDGAQLETRIKAQRGRISVASLVMPGDVEFKAGSVRMGDAPFRFFSAWSFGGTLDDAFLTGLLQNNVRVSVSKHIDHIEKETAIEQLRRRMQALEADKQARLKKNRQSGESYVPLELEENVENTRQLIQRLKGDEDLFRTSLVIGVAARNEEELAEGCALIRSKAAEHYVNLKPLTLQQEEALSSVMPYGKCFVRANTLMLSSEVGVMTPFSYPTFLDAGGIYYGLNIRTGEPVIIDRKRDKNSNGFIFGKSGSGKSFYAKLELSALLALPALKDDRIIVVDPDGEFTGIAAANAEQSEVIRLSSASSTVINPFEVSSYELRAYGDEAVNNKVQYVLSFISALKGGELTAVEKTVADRAATRCYRRYLDDEKKDMPTLHSFDAELEGMEEAEAKQLRLYVERYISGSIKLFSGKTNVSLEKKLTVFNLAQLGGELKDTGMLALLTVVWAKVLENHAAGRWTWIYFDELHRYYRAENSLAAVEIERLYAEIRKWGGVVTSMTQHPAGVLASPTASSMLTNSQFVVLFEQDDANVEAMAERMKLNEDQRRLLLASETGEAVLRARNSTVAVRLEFPRDNEVYRTITTDFKDVSGK